MEKITTILKQVEAQGSFSAREITENEVLSLHAGNFARYQIKPSQFSAWQETWNEPI